MFVESLRRHKVLYYVQKMSVVKPFQLKDFIGGTSLVSDIDIKIYVRFFPHAAFIFSSAFNILFLS